MKYLDIVVDMLDAERVQRKNYFEDCSTCQFSSEEKSCQGKCLEEGPCKKPCINSKVKLICTHCTENKSVNALRDRIN